MIKVLEKLRAVNNGGIEAFVFNSVQFIRSDKLDIHYYSDIPPAAEKYKQCVKNNGKTIDVPSRDYEKISFKPVRVWLKWFDFYKYCRKEQFDIVHIHMCRPYDVLYAAAVRFSGKSRIILHSHFSNRSDVKSLEKKFDRVFQRLSSKLGDSFCACSNSAAEYMFEKNSRYTIVKNGIDTARFGFDAYLRKITRDKLGVGDRLVIGHVARLCEIKNQLFLVDVFDCIHRKAPESVLLIAGEGDYRKKIEKRVSELGLDSSVIFTGAVDDPVPYYSAMDVFLLTSLFEGMPFVTLESQSSGLPTICSDGIPGEAAVTELCSFMPLKASAEKWAEHILERAVSFERRSYVEEIKAAGYDIADTASKLEEIYLSL